MALAKTFESSDVTHSEIAKRRLLEIGDYTGHVINPYF